MPRSTPAKSDGATAFWGQFGSSELDALLEFARTDSLDVAEAAARIDQAAAAVQAAKAPLLPSVEAVADIFVQSTNSRSLGSVSGTFVDAGIAAAYELDFWGKNQAYLGAARAGLQASRYDRIAASLTVAASVAVTYFQILGLRERIAITESSVTAAGQMLDLVESRARAGAALVREAAQQRSLLAQEQAAVERLKRQESAARVALSLILGRPVSWEALTADGLQSLHSPPVTRGIPPDLLSRRPDLARIEAQLAACRANVDAARAAVLPRVRLTASVGLQTAIVSTEATDTGLLYLATASVSQSIFDGGTAAAMRQRADAERREWLVKYKRAVLAATAEVQKALQDLSGIDQELASLQIVADQAQIASHLAETEYRAGAGELLAVLDTQRTLAQANNALSETRLARFLTLAGLFKAVGGGWNERSGS
ncbi:MAG TPA: TolC family protein [Polyangiaceae bacterium]